MQRVLNVLVKVKGAAKANKSIKSLGKNSSTSRASLLKFGAGITAAAAALYKMGEALVGVSSRMADHGEAMDQAAKQMGLTVATTQAMNEAARENGFRLKDLERGMTKLRKAYVEAGKEQMSGEEMLRDFANELKNTESETERLMKVQENLGQTAGPRMAAFLSKGASAIDDMKKKMGDGLMTEDDIGKALEYQEAMNKLHHMIQGLKVEVFSHLADYIVKATENIVEFIDSADLGFIGETVEEIVSFVKELFLVLKPGLGFVFKMLKPIAKIIGGIIRTALKGWTLIFRKAREIRTKVQNWISSSDSFIAKILRWIQNAGKRVWAVFDWIADKMSGEEGVSPTGHFGRNIGTKTTTTPTPTTSATTTTAAATASAGTGEPSGNPLLTAVIHLKNEFIAFVKWMRRINAGLMTTKLGGGPSAVSGTYNITVDARGDGAREISDKIKNTIQNIHQNQIRILDVLKNDQPPQTGGTIGRGPAANPVGGLHG